MSKSASLQNYCIQPLLVTDLTSQCAAHFLNWFSQKPLPAIAAVVKIGIHGNGGLVDQVDAWFELCEADIRGAAGSGEHWNTDLLGPWVYEELAVPDVAGALASHIRGWSATSISNYSRLAKAASSRRSAELSPRHG